MSSITITDDALIAELKLRFDQTKQALYDVKMVTKKLEAVNKKLESSEQVKSNFVSHMKNEINNPLTSILGLSQQLGSIASDPNMVEMVASSIYSEAFSLDFQLRNIFMAAELESGETEMQISMVDIDTVIADTIDSFKHIAAEKGIVTQFAPNRPEGEKLLFKTDSDKIHQVFGNLLSNAIEFNHQDGEVEILADLVDSQLRITIKDTGTGIDPANIDRIFDRFTQMEAGVTKSHKGHGLGLSIVKAAIDLMGGSISMNNNQGDTPGCTFIITVPEVEMDVDADAFSVDGNEFFFDDGDDAEAF
ncbi:MAG: HAMP domain-containing histidine kinase [Magnetococcales bacterium]|nr:HAMP domain-containing histidine kinase [Magnetococcales bacterium]